MMGMSSPEWSRYMHERIGLVGHSGWVFLLLAVYGVFPAFTDGVGKAWISSLVTDEHRGRAQGVFQSLTNGAVFVAGLWAGLTWTLGPGNHRHTRERTGLRGSRTP